MQLVSENIEQRLSPELLQPSIQSQADKACLFVFFFLTKNWEMSEYSFKHCFVGLSCNFLAINIKKAFRSLNSSMDNRVEITFMESR